MRYTWNSADLFAVWQALNVAQYSSRRLCRTRTQTRGGPSLSKNRHLVGERGFLACAEVLQHTLLPLLSASTLFRLSCTSRGLQKWLLQTPPSLWQVQSCRLGSVVRSTAPCQTRKRQAWTLQSSIASTDICLLQDVPSRDLAPAFLATMPDTAAVLAALRTAHTARLAIEAGQEPVERQVVQLSTLSAWREGCSDGLRLACRSVAFSTDGQFMALSLHSSGCRSSSPRHYVSDYGVAVLKVTEGFIEQACICSGPWYPTFSWAPAEPNLSIAIRGSEDGKSNACAQQPAVFVLDVKTGAALHALGPKNLSLFWQACFEKDPQTKLNWAPTGSLLLVTRRSSWGTNTEQNLLSVFDIRQDMLLAQSTFKDGPNVGCAKVIATWTPNSQGLVMSHGVQLQAEEAFAGQGLALGILPEPCVVHDISSPGGAFSPDGRRFIVCDAHDYWDEEHSSRIGPSPFRYRSVMQYQVEGLHIHFRHESWFEGYRPFWLPCGTGLVVKVDCMSQHSKIMLLGDHQHHERLIAGTVMRPCFSPSHKLMASSSAGPCIFSLQSGHKVWALAQGDTDTRQQQPQQQAVECLAFLPSGCGVICKEDFAGHWLGQPHRKENVDRVHILLFA